MKALPTPTLAGRPNTLYYKLFMVIPRDGDWYPVRYFAGANSAYEAARWIRLGARPLPGGRGRWEIAAQKMTRKEMEDLGDGSRSVLYAKWKGPKVRNG